MATASTNKSNLHVLEPLTLQIDDRQSQRIELLKFSKTKAKDLVRPNLVEWNQIENNF